MRFIKIGICYLVLFSNLACGGLFNRFHGESTPLSRLKNRVIKGDCFINDRSLTQEAKERHRQDAKILVQRLIFAQAGQQLEGRDLDEELIELVYNYLILVKVSDDAALNDLQSLYIHVNTTLENSVQTDISLEYTDQNQPILHYKIEKDHPNEGQPRIMEWKVIFKEFCAEDFEVTKVSNDEIDPTILNKLKELAKEEFLKS